MLGPQSGLVVLCFIAILNIGLIEATCYTPDGVEAKGDSPCTSSSDSMCCPGEPGASICLSNGLCWVPSQNAAARSSCTDSTWSSSVCTNICRDVNKDKFCQITPCADGVTFACGLGEVAWGQCDSGSGFNLNVGSFVNVKAGDAATVTAATTLAVTETETETKTETETEVSTTTVVTQGNGGVFSSTQIITETKTTTTVETATACPGGSTLSPATCPTAVSTATSGGQSGGAVNPAAAASCPDCSTKQLTVGVGVGVPLTAALLCALMLLFWQKKRDKNSQQVLPPPPVAAPYEYIPQPMQQGYGQYAAGGGYISPHDPRDGAISPTSELNARTVHRAELGDQRPPTYLSTK